MNKSKKLLYIILIINTVFVLKIYSQDIHFSQFYNSPLSVSPSFTGNFKGDWRISNNYRTQWRSIATPYKTLSIGYDQKVRLFYQDFSAGIYLVNDNSSYAFLAVNKVYLSIAYHKRIKKNEFHIGIQPGYTFSSFNKENLTFPNQYDHSIGSFNGNLSSGENNLDEKISYLDINIGAAWNGIFGRLQPMAAISIFHLNNPKQSFLNERNRLPLRISLYGGGKYILNDNWTILPHLSYMFHKNANEFLLGSNIDMKLHLNNLKIQSIYGGLLFRDGFRMQPDALIFIAGFTLKNFNIGFSYDYNISHLRLASNTHGALEFSLIYINKASFIPKTTLPCERY